MVVKALLLPMVKPSTLEEEEKLSPTQMSMNTTSVGDSSSHLYIERIRRKKFINNYCKECVGAWLMFCFRWQLIHCAPIHWTVLNSMNRTCTEHAENKHRIVLSEYQCPVNAVIHCSQCEVLCVFCWIVCTEHAQNCAQGILVSSCQRCDPLQSVWSALCIFCCT